MKERATMSRDVWVDFNDLDGDLVDTLLDFVETDRPLLVGMSVVVGDDDGTRCPAEVVGIGERFVTLRLARPPARAAG